MSEKVELNKNVEEKTPFLTKVKAITEQRWFFQVLPVVLLILMTLLRLSCKDQILTIVRFVRKGKTTMLMPFQYIMFMVFCRDMEH